MASFCKISQIPISVSNLCKVFNTVLNTTKLQSGVNKSFPLVPLLHAKQFHLTSRKCDLMEFFDDKKNWGENEVKTGRSWKKDELRIKSNSDLHKLWYILLKEKNMLLTMEHECKEQYKLFPSPERIDKVEESIKNLEEVVRERNKAYYLLETGETGERPGELVQNQLGLNTYYKHTEHLIPKVLNRKWKLRHQFFPRGNAVSKFLLYYREKLYLAKRRQKTRDENHVMSLIKRFPNLDLTAVKSQYPHVNIEKCLTMRKARGHYVPK